MVKVALAGATGGLGATILSAILDTGKHEVVVLSRSPNPSLTAKGVQVRPVSYTDHTSLTAALRDIHTVLSTIGSFNRNEQRDSQLAIIAAAKEVGVKQRRASTPFGNIRIGIFTLARYRYWKPQGHRGWNTHNSLVVYS